MLRQLKNSLKISLIIYLSISASFIKSILVGQLVKLWWVGDVFEEDHGLGDDVVSSSATAVVFDSSVGVEDLDRRVS